jgi:hypothetical protein
MRYLVIIFSLFLVGCPKERTAAQPAAPIGTGANVSSATAHANAAQTAAGSAEAERLGKVRANIDAAAVAPNIDSAPVAVNELTVAQARLADVAPDPAEVAAAAERRALVEAGRAEEARAAAQVAAADGKRDATRIRELEDEAMRLQAERDRIAAEFVAQAERNRIENQKAIDAALAQAAAAEDARKDAVRKKQIVLLNWIGALAIVAAGAIVGIGGMFAGFSLPVIKRLVPASACCCLVGLFVFAAAQFIASRWFWPVMGGGTVLALLGGGAYLYRSERAKQKAAQKAAVADATRPVLDAAYESGTAKLTEVAAQLKSDGSATVQDLLDAIVFKPLSDATKGTSVQAAVHLMRAEEKGAAL